jgi:Mor family transcriptional regulator
MKDPVTMDAQIKIEDLPRIYQTFAKIIGLENVLKLAREIGGECIYCPKLNGPKSPFIKQRDAGIIAEFDGHNARALAIKHGITIYRIYAILRRQRNANKRQ